MTFSFWSVKQSLSIKNLLQRLPPRCFLIHTARRTGIRALLHAIGHDPPFLHFGVGPHLEHISLKVGANVFECGEEGLVIVEENRVWQ